MATDREYWELRAERLGASAAGYSDAAMDAYEDALRGSVIRRLLGEGGGRTLLDAGCGGGRWSVRLARAGWIVTGVDLSPRLIAMAPRAEDVTYIAAPIQDLDLPSSSFDAWISVTALQHITADDAFAAALANLTRMLKPGGRAGLLEYAPLWPVGPVQPHLRRRTRRQWLDAMAGAGYTRRAEAGVRFVGHVPYMLAVRAARGRTLPWLRAACRSIDRGLSLIPGLSLAGDVRMIVFEKAPR